MSRKRIHNEEEKGITIQRSKVKVQEYPNQITLNGLFNPICPAGFNFLTGWTEFRDTPNQRGVALSMSGRLNGKPTHNF